MFMDDNNLEIIINLINASQSVVCLASIMISLRTSISGDKRKIQTHNLEIYSTIP